MKVCIQCEEPNPDKNVTCFECGAELPTAGNGHQLEPTDNELQVGKDFPYTTVVTLAAPKETVWEPHRAAQLIDSFFSIGEQFKLFILAGKDEVTWGLEIPYWAEQIVENNILTHYPHAQLEYQGKTQTLVGWYGFHIEAGTAFIAPLKYADDTEKLDPLTSVVGAMVGLDEDEYFAYELTLTPTSKATYDLAEKLLTTSSVNWQTYLTHGVTAPAIAQATGADQVERFIPEMQEVFTAKAQQPMYNVRLAAKIKTDNPDRATYLFGSFLPGLGGLAGDYNWLKAAEPDSYPLSLWSQEIASLWHPPTQDCTTPGIVWVGGVTSALPSNLLKEPTESYITLGENKYRGKTYPVRLTYSDRVTHINIIGKTRVGKSTLIHKMAHQDIEAGKGVAVIDPHGDLVGDILACSIPKEREQDVVLFDIRDQKYPIGLNLLAPVPGLSDEAVAGQALAVLKKLFDVEYWSTKIEDSLYAAIRPLVSYPGATIEDISRIFINDEFRHQILSQLDGAVDIGFWEEYESMHPMVKNEISSPVTRRIRRFYRDPTIRRMVCQQACLDLSHILNTNKIFLVNLGGGVDVSEIDTYTIGALLIARLQLAAMSRVKLPRTERTPYYLYIDEVQNFVTTSLSKMFSEVAKYGLSLVVANQFLNQLQSVTGDTLEAILGNVGTSIIFRVGTPDDKSLAPHVKPNFTEQDLLNLDRFHTVVKMQADGQTLDAFSMRTLPPLSPYENVTERVERIRQRSRGTYARPVAEVNEEFKQRQHSTFSGVQPPDASKTTS